VRSFEIETAGLTALKERRDQKEGERILSNHLGWILTAAMLTMGSPPARKTPIRGLISMGAYRFVAKGGEPVNTLEPLNAKPGIFGGIVILASWRELQASHTSGLAENNNIDRALAEVRQYNRRNPQKPLAVKLRVWGGFMAPDWAKQLGGSAASLTITTWTLSRRAAFLKSPRF